MNNRVFCQISCNENITFSTLIILSIDLNYIFIESSSKDNSRCSNLFWVSILTKIDKSSQNDIPQLGENSIAPSHDMNLDVNGQIHGTLLAAAFEIVGEINNAIRIALNKIISKWFHNLEKIQSRVSCWRLRRRREFYLWDYERVSLLAVGPGSTFL